METATAPRSSRIVVVTGAGTGIGRVTARAFAAEGAHVLAVGRRAEPLDETAAGHARITPLAADITAVGEPERIVRAARELHGGLDVLINNAGIVRSGPLGTLTSEAIAAQIATNLIAPTMLAQAALPLLEATGGVMVNVSTSVGQRAWPGSAVYAATKVALEVLTRSWAVELAPAASVWSRSPPALSTPPSATIRDSHRRDRTRCASGSWPTPRWVASAAPRRLPGPSLSSPHQPRRS